MGETLGAAAVDGTDEEGVDAPHSGPLAPDSGLVDEADTDESETDESETDEPDPHNDGVGPTESGGPNEGGAASDEESPAPQPTTDPTDDDTPADPVEVESPGGTTPENGLSGAAPELDDTTVDSPPPAVGAAASAPSSAVPAPEATASAAPRIAASRSVPAARTQVGERVVLDAGHVDLIEVTRSGDGLVLSVKDDTRPGGAVFRRPADVQSRVSDGARTQIPAGAAFDFLGPAGSDIWLLPQVQDADLLWPGWSTERLLAGQVQGNAVTMRLRSVDGPGRVDVFTTDQFGTPARLFGPGAPGELVVPINTHAHANWAFSAPGQYRLTVEVSGTLQGGPATSTVAEYVFLVGDGTPPAPWDSIAPGGSGPGTTTGGAGTGGAGPDSGAGPGGDVDGADAGTGPGAGGAAGSNGAARGATSTAADVGGTGSLASTGGEVVPLLAVGGALVMFGAIALVAARRRRVLRGSGRARFVRSTGHV